MIPFSRGKFVGPVPCKVISSTEITAVIGDDPPETLGQNMWKYVVAPLVWDLTNYITSDVTGDVYSNQEMKAINTFEMGNTNLFAMGISIPSLPEGFALEPVPLGAVVMVWMAPGGGTDVNGFETIALFTWPTQFNGTCPE